MGLRLVTLSRLSASLHRPLFLSLIAHEDCQHTQVVYRFECTGQQERDPEQVSGDEDTRDQRPNALTRCLDDVDGPHDSCTLVRQHYGSKER